MEFKIKMGDKCKIPKTKSVESRYEESAAIKEARLRKQDFLYYTGFSRTSQNHMLWYEFDPNHKTGDHFLEHEIELYEEKQETMKNLLETEFVIENCTLSQRLAIKAYCDEKKIRIYEGSFSLRSCKSFPNLRFDKTRFVGTTNLNAKVITFSELIRFLDQYQPEPEFKVGDFVLLKDNAGGYGGYDMISKQIVKILEITNIESKRKYIRFIFNDESNTTIVEKIERHATSEEIKKWKEENEIKLPRINGYDGLLYSIGINTMLKWGCTEISISTVKELLNAGVDHITIKGNHVLDFEIKQIKKFIEHNKL